MLLHPNHNYANVNKAKLFVWSQCYGPIQELHSRKKTNYRIGRYSSIYRFPAVKLGIVKTSGKRCVIRDFVSNAYNVHLHDCHLLLPDSTRQMSNNHPSFHHFHCKWCISVADFASALECCTSHQYPIIMEHRIAPNTRTKLGFR